MEWETLPNWFWLLYYLFLLTTLVTTIYSVMKRKKKGLSIVATLFTIMLPIITLLNSIGRATGINEFEHLVNQLQEGALWVYFTSLGYLFLISWWVLFLSKRRPNSTFKLTWRKS